MTPTGPVLFAYDGSQHARAAIAQGGALLRPGPAVVATAWAALEEAAPPVLLALPGGIARDAARDIDDAQREAAERLAAEGAALAAEAGFEAEPRALRAAGPFFSALVECADELDARVVVVGTRGRSTLAATVLGSVSTGVLHHTRRPVLALRGSDE